MDHFDHKREVLHGLTDMLKRHASDEVGMKPVGKGIEVEKVSVVPAKEAMEHSHALAEGGPVEGCPACVEHAESPAEEQAETPAEEQTEHPSELPKAEGEVGPFDTLMAGVKNSKKSKVFNKYSDLK